MSSLQGGREEAAERSLPEGGGPARQAPEGSQAGGVRSCYGSDPAPSPPPDLTRQVNVTNREQRLEILDKQFLELEAHYRSVLEKVAAA